MPDLYEHGVRAALAGQKGSTVTVLLTHLDDERGLRALESLRASTLRPIDAVLADGGSRPELLGRYQALATTLGFPLKLLRVPGSVADSRELSWRSCQGDVIAFLDSDEVAPPDWLRTLTEPILARNADFAAGPTKPLTVRDAWERYHAGLEDWFYDEWVSRDVIYAPMGNTAWRRNVFEKLAGQDGYAFDRRLRKGGEDFDVNIRAVRAGFRGVYVPEAILLHDHARLKGMRKVLRKKYHYAVAEFRLQRRHRDFLASRPTPRPTRKKPRHASEALEPFVRRWARWKSRKLA